MSCSFCHLPKDHTLSSDRTKLQVLLCAVATPVIPATQEADAQLSETLSQNKIKRGLG